MRHAADSARTRPLGACLLALPRSSQQGVSFFAFVVASTGTTLALDALIYCPSQEVQTPSRSVSSSAVLDVPLCGFRRSCPSQTRVRERSEVRTETGQGAGFGADVIVNAKRDSRASTCQSKGCVRE